MRTRRLGFTRVELLASLVLVLIVALMLPALMRGVRSPAGMYVSLNNVRQIVRAMHQYRADTGGQMPMRGSSYFNGRMASWDPWHFGGKNCDSSPTVDWISWRGGINDELAYWRPLNQYLTRIAIPPPRSSRDTGTGSSWDFSQGFITLAERRAIDLPMFNSPGDVLSYQGSTSVLRTLGTPDPNGVTCYDAVGTSYLLNMAWWDSRPFSLQSDFTARFDMGVKYFRGALDNTRPEVDAQTATPSRPSEIVWITDQTAQMVYYGQWFRLPLPWRGEFGGDNRSVSGFLDGHAGYVEYTPSAMRGADYTFHPQ